MRPSLIALAGWLALAFAQGTYTVQRGDTLFSIAQRHGTTVEALQALNNLADPSQIRVGQVLRLGGQPSAPAVNRRTDLPAPIEALEWPRQTVQGNVAVIRLIAALPVNGRVRFLGADYPVQQNRVLLPIPALQDPGVYPASLSLEGYALRLDIRVVAGSFSRYILQLPPDRAALLQPEKLRTEREKVVGSCDWDRPQQWQGNWRKPVGSNRVTDPFGTRRSYDKGATYSFHEGIDYGVPVGTPVRAPAAGVVGLAEPLFVRGNGVTIDHGDGVCSGFWHLSKILVRPGQVVKAGDLIGLSGNTGLSNGPHAHFEIRVRGVPTNPAPWYWSAP
ncbi:MULTISPECIES: M23 family metallopeptidase [unclassified Meiothermus]|uniref:LysM peptidoglycan-binding domain-containing M23 family metallopeptidase n=1 Tax=unclassified Meiothermus TaxID=370471 RepID=UPI000D7D22D5|nr:MULTISPECIES: M23 family metallopeptidase [unclassified Meiothermus]PZA06481.1 M23 family peptidase [Meiothermus sp. Pnk-1]RYM36252.1 M23 family metallopeptidase [Meiothermus sp. PNK-Is4]